MGWGDSNSGPPPEGVPGGGCAGSLTCGSFALVVTAGARCTPLPANSACIQRVPLASGPVGRTPLRSSPPGQPMGSVGLRSRLPPPEHEVRDGHNPGGADDGPPPRPTATSARGSGSLADA
jgi:hypothetical protein